MTPVCFDSPGKVRRVLGDDLFCVRPAVYWLDFGTSISVGWAAFFLALPHYSPGILARLFWISIAVLAFYRALFFIHEIIHFRKESLYAFRWVWNALCGSMFFLPDFTYLIHISHHSVTTFSTKDDPEYVPIAYQKPLQLLAPFLVFPLVPFFMMMRFLVAAPLSWIIRGPFRRWLLSYASSLKMNPKFEWRNITAEDRRLAVLQESGCIVWWSIFLALAFSTREPRIVLQWYLIVYCILNLNHLRAMVAHRYINGAGERLSYEDQLLDSITITGFSPLASILAPVGLRYHSLHHLFPTLPYHALAQAHNRLIRVLPPNHIYFKTLVPSIISGFCSFLENARARSSRTSRSTYSEL
jgi:fatty acid desaturase